MEEISCGSLEWPREAAQPPSGHSWHQTGSNICLDFHGDPLTAKLVVFSDGNHHMALEACLRRFLSDNPAVVNIFYATTPPRVLIKLMDTGALHLGNLRLSASPHLFIGPEDILDGLVASGKMARHASFMQSRGNVLLVRRDNPRGISGIADLVRDDVRLFISNPLTERASHDVYSRTIVALAEEQEVELSVLEQLLSGNSGRLLAGEHIHHREAPQAVADNRADVAMVYYHLALRYTRIFPDQFELIPLGGTRSDPNPSPVQVITHYRIGLIGDGGEWGGRLFDFMRSTVAAELYREHGLLRSES